MKDQLLLSKIHTRTTTIAVIGLGYVGLPLAVAFAEKGFPVVGIDVDGRKVAALNRGESYVQDIPSARLAGVTGQGQIGKSQSPTVNLPACGTLIATTDFSILAQCDAAIICVPTPLTRRGTPTCATLLRPGNRWRSTCIPECWWCSSPRPIRARRRICCCRSC